MEQIMLHFMMHKETWPIIYKNVPTNCGGDVTPSVCSPHLDPPGVRRQVEAAAPVIVAVAGHHRAVVQVGGEQEGVPQHPADDGLHLRLSASPQLLLALALVPPGGECTV